MDPYSIFVDNLPRNLSYGQIRAAFWPFQQTSGSQIVKKEHYLLITFTKEETVQRILEEKDRIRLKGQRVHIKQASKRLNFVHLPPSFFLPPEVLVPVITNSTGSVHFLRWKKVLIANPTDFRVSITDLQNTPVVVKSKSHILLAFKKV